MFHFEKRRAAKASSTMAGPSARSGAQPRRASSTSQRRRGGAGESTASAKGRKTWRSRSSGGSSKYRKKKQSDKQHEDTDSDSGVWSSGLQPITSTIRSHEAKQARRANDILPKFDANSERPHKRLTLAPVSEEQRDPEAVRESIEQIMPGVAVASAKADGRALLRAAAKQGKASLAETYRAEVRRGSGSHAAHDRQQLGTSEPFSEYMEDVGERPAHHHRLHDEHAHHSSKPLPDWLRRLGRDALREQQQLRGAELSLHSSSALAELPDDAHTVSLFPCSDEPSTPDWVAALLAREEAVGGASAGGSASYQPNEHARGSGSSLYLSQLRTLPTAASAPAIARSSSPISLPPPAARLPAQRFETPVPPADPQSEADFDAETSAAAVLQAQASAFWKGGKPRQTVSFCFDTPTKGPSVSFVEKQINDGALVEADEDVFEEAQPSSSHGLENDLDDFP